MAAFPSYARIALADVSMEHRPVSERSEVERGLPRVRRTSSDALVSVLGVVLLRSTADVLAFEDWYYSAAGANAGMGWFDWRDPRNGTLRSARLASLGAVRPDAGKFRLARWACTIEYLRSTY